MTGHLRLGSRIGDLLYELAREPRVRRALDIGTWKGQGSTYCLARGLSETSGALTSVEAKTESHLEAVGFYEGMSLPVTLVNGLTLSVQDYEPYDAYEPLIATHEDEAKWPGLHRKWYDQELELARRAPRDRILHELTAGGEGFDLAVFDGGEFISRAEFLYLEPYLTGYVVLDDTNGRRAIKNVLNREYLLRDPSWEVLRDEQDDRNGWLVARRSYSSRVRESGWKEERERQLRESGR
ncbi:MAG: hypothetical protein C4521_02400 [Actinobacteria bacterium]|nr:MAG: hypothetical protein C4521_02400 [Actinomycetota bacterium]